MSKARVKKVKKVNGTPATPVATQQSAGKQENIRAVGFQGSEKIWLLGILILTFLAFSPSLFNDFVNWDDYAYIVDNPVIRSLSLDNIKYIFDTNTFVVGNYHPLTVITYAIEYALVGLDPFLYHLDNIILHLLNTFIFFFLVKRLTSNQTMAILVTAFFAIHPMRVESVTWAAERKDVLYTLFFLLSTWYYLLFREKEGSLKYYVISMILFLCSILSKGQAVVLPLTLVLIDIYTNRKIDKKWILEKIPYFALSLLFGLLATQAQHTSLTDKRLATYSMGERLLFACYGTLQYIKQLLVPVKLSNFYSYPAKVDGTFPILVYVAPVLVGCLIYLLYKFRRNKVVLFGGLYFLATIFIVLQLLPVGDAITADRYTYIPYIGLFFIGAHGMERMLEYKSYRQVVTYSLGAYFLVLAFLTFNRTKDWQNSEVLWSDVIEKYPETAIAYNNRGVVKNGKEQVDEAILDYKMAIKSDPKYFEAYNNLAGAYGQKGMQKEEFEFYAKTIEIEPGYVPAYFNRGLSYAKYGKYDLALKDYETAKSGEPNSPKIYYSIGIVYKNMGRPDLAIENYTKAVSIDPYYIDAYNNRANIYFGQQNYDAAIRDYNQALLIQPNAGTTLLNRSAAYYGKRDFASALRDALKAQEAGATVDQAYFDILKAGGH